MASEYISKSTGNEQHDIDKSDGVDGFHSAPAAAQSGDKQIHTVSQVRSPIPGVANPGPLGLIGFAVTTFVLGLYECGAG